LSKELTARQTDAMERGDHAGALDLAGGTLAMGRQLSSDGTHTLITQLVGIAIESQALAPLDAAQTPQVLGQTAAERKAQLDAQKTEIRTLTANADIACRGLSDADILAYLEREAASGEMDALRWLASQHQP
jgi:hypothetical protein